MWSANVLVDKYSISFIISFTIPKVHIEIHKPVCKQSLWLVPELKKPIKCIVYKPVYEYY
jgi:hypothetical protein